MGFWILKFCEFQWKSNLENAIFSVACGYGVLSLLILLLASLHLLYQPLLIGLWIAGVAGFFYCLNKKENREYMKDSIRECRQAFWGNEVPILFRIFLWLFLGISFMMAHVPELFYDSLVYHVGVPNLYLQEGGIVRIPGNLSRVPLLWQMLYVLGLALSDEMLPKLIHWSSGLLLVLGLRSLALRLGFEAWLGVLAGLFFLSVPMVQMNLWTTGIDIGSCLFSFLAIYAAITWLKQSNLHPHLLPVRMKESISPLLNKEREWVRIEEQYAWLILSAIMAGFAYGSKYQGGILAANLFLVVLLFQFLKVSKSFKEFLKISLIFAGTLILAILPWLTKNFWDTGNPVFPFLSDLFQKLSLQRESVDPWQYKYFIAENRRFMGLSWKDAWKLPWKLTLEWNQSSLSYPGPLFLALLPAILIPFQKLRSNWFQFMLAFLLLFFTFAFSSTHLTRYHLQGYPLLCFFYALGFYFCWLGHSLLWKGILTFLLSLIFLVNLQTGISIIANSYHPWDVLSGRESREAYRSYTHPGLNPYPSNAMFRWMEKNLNRNTRTLFIGESKNFDLKLPYLYTDVHGLNPVVVWSSKAKNASELYEKFRGHGITHLFINFTEARRTYGYKMIQWKNQDLEKFKNFWDLHVRELHREKIPERFFASDSVLLLYEVLPADTASARGAPPVNPLLILEEVAKKQ